MAKDPGLSFKSEQEFSKEFSKSMNPSAFNQVVQQLRATNLSAKNISTGDISAKTIKADQTIKDSKEVQSNQEEIKSGEKLLESHKKLTTNIEKLTKTISNSVLGKANRAEDIAGKQKLDYRSIGQQFKEKIMGRGGDKWDTNSLRYKLGSLRGLARTTGLVSEGGFIDNKMAVREERLRTATRMTEANAGMENLKQFGSKAAVENYYQRRGKETIKARAGLQTEEYNREKYREAGISDEEYERTTGGKRQIRSLGDAGQAVIAVDPRMQGEKKGDIRFAGPGPDDDKLNVSEEESSQLKAIESASKPTEELINITKVENERKEKADKDLLEAVKGISTSGGALGGIANAASNLVGGKGAILKKGAGYLSKVGGVGKLAKGLGIGAIGALAGEGIQYGGEKLKEAGYEQTGKAVGVAGTATKYAGYGAMIGSVVPGVGTAIGAGVGGLVGAGKGVYDQYFSGDGKTTKIANNNLSPEQSRAIAKQIEQDDELSDSVKMTKAEARAIMNDSGSEVATRSSDNAIAKTSNNSQPSNTIVNAPTTVSKQTQNTNVKVPIRDQDHSIKSYYRSRFAS